MIKLIADSGSTKTDWTLLDADGREQGSCHSQGLNPYHLSEEEISGVLRGEVIPSLFNQEVIPFLFNKCVGKVCSLGNDPKPSIAIYFYGSGVTDAMIPKMERLLMESFQASGLLGDIETHAASDMLGAARALLGHESGVAVILGTGSNSCYYDGENIVKGIPPLGYVLGDEGSGTAIGKAFFRLIYRNPKAAPLRGEFEKWSGMDYAAVIDRIYRQPLANTFLASVSAFVGSHQDDPLVISMLRQVYRDFCREMLSFYSGSVKIGFVGSIAHYFRCPIGKAISEAGFLMGPILQSPMSGLICYHAEY